MPDPSIDSLLYDLIEVIGANMQLLLKELADIRKSIDDLWNPLDRFADAL